MTGIQLKLISAGIIVILLVGAFWYHGHVQYRKGVNDTQAAHLSDQLKAGKDARKEVASNEKKFKAMPADDLDVYGSKRGWVRAEQDL